MVKQRFSRELMKYGLSCAVIVLWKKGVREFGRGMSGDQAERKKIPTTLHLSIVPSFVFTETYDQCVNHHFVNT
eukprot:m.96123 g.96123  ORF g.96123 m.96123 type:complete len:74 (-) comp18466_c0_seq7:54-275(-)